MRVLIIVAHGSRKQDASLELAALVRKLDAKAHPFDRITHAFLQFSGPFLPDVIESAVNEGATQVVLFPFFIATGSHVLTDIPEAMAAAAKAHPSVEFSLTRHLGVAEGVGDLILGEVAAHLAEQDHA